jgi:hypothetical protein
LVTFYAAMVLAGLVVEILFGALGLVPDERSANVVEASVTWNYTTFLNLFFIGLSVLLVARFFRTGGPAMLRMMKGGPQRPSPESGHDGEVFTCPMHPEVSSAAPGRCPKCGMDLVPG